MPLVSDNSNSGIPDDGSDETKHDIATLQDFVASQFFSYGSYADASVSGKPEIRQWMRDFFAVTGSINQIIDQIKDGTFNVNSTQGRILNQLVAKRTILDEFVKTYVAVVDIDAGGWYSADNFDSKNAGYLLIYLIDNLYIPYTQAKTADTPAVVPEDYIADQINKMGIGLGKQFNFQPVFDHIDTNKAVREMFLRPDKFRDDTTPDLIAPYQCRIGASTFLVPPTAITVHQAFKAGSLTNGVLRQPNSPKMNLGHSETEINMTLYFPNHESIWGFAGDRADFDIFNWDPVPTASSTPDTGNGDRGQQAYNGGAVSLVSDKIIDRYLSSLRGLITQFKYAPFLPVKNEYLNRTYGIDAVTMMGMTVTTVPDFPFVLAVNLQMARFNYKPFMPMIDDFDTAIHWGKYRQYMGKAAARLDGKVNQGFLIEKTVNTPDATATSQTISVSYESDLIPRFNKSAEIENGKNFDFYYPITTPGRIFAPDTTDFRQPGEDQVVTEDIWDGVLSTIGLDIRSSPNFNFFEYDRAYRGSKYRNERKVLFEWLHANTVDLQLMDDKRKAAFIKETVDSEVANNKIAPDAVAQLTADLNEEWFNMVYELLITDAAGFKALKDSQKFKDSHYTIKEWQVPMEKLAMDWTHCIVNNVSVSLSNNFAAMQIQLQDEPTYQHIGGGDSRIDVSMTVLGEDNLIRFRRLFDHINGLARLEKIHGVLGFLGIKNVVTAMCGVKYVLPLDMEVETVPNFPHVYRVSMSFIDFDIMQQEREQLSSAQQQYLVDLFGKKNPFLRLKQAWGMFNAYPDFPLDVRDDDNNVLAHLDADWYFRSFVTTHSDDKIFNWGFNEEVIGLVRSISDVQAQLNDDTFMGDKEDRVGLQQQLEGYEQQLRGLVAGGATLPSSWQIVDGKVVPVSTYQVGDDKDSRVASSQQMPEPEMIQHLGFFDKDQVKSSIIAFFEGGYFALGWQDVRTKEIRYQLGMSAFKEDLASSNLKGVPSVPGTVPIPQYQTEYFNGSDNPNEQYEAIMQDYNYRNLRGRMIKAFPTYMLWLIDEGGNFAGVKLFDNFYGLNSVIDFSVIQSEDAPGDTLILRLSNIYNKLTTPYKDQIINEDDPLYDTVTGRWITTAENRLRNIESGTTDKIIEINSIRLKPGVRVHLRMGYGANPNALQTVFNGVVAEVEPGDVMTVTCQSDAVEFTGYVNTVNNDGSSGKLDGNITGFWLSEPRDLMVRLLTMGSSNFKEWLAWGSKGVLFSDSRFGIRHFGNILYEPMSFEETNGLIQQQGAVSVAVNTPASPNGQTGESFQSLLGGYANSLVDITSITSLPSALNGNLIKIAKMLWLNQFSKRDYEIFKRNIYPGNGSGIAQFMGGDQIDAGVTVAAATSYTDSALAVSPSTPARDTDRPNADGWTPSSVIPFVLSTVDPEKNKQLIDGIWQSLDQPVALSDGEVVDIQTLLADPNKNAAQIQIKEVKSEGLLDSLLGGIGDIVSAPFNAIGYLGDADEWLSGALGGGLAGQFGSAAIEFVLGGGPVLPFLSKFTGLLSGAGRLLMGGQGGLGSLGHILGLNSGISDDDLQGFDEVSFRAQTYMKTVWDLFQLCAALLPNYIVAVRPFEDRSTVFYGKPHWLYTSGVIPVTLGVPKDSVDPMDPKMSGPDQVMHDILEQAKDSSSSSVEQMMSTVDASDALNDIMSFNSAKSLDPNNVGGTSNRGVLSTRQDYDDTIKKLNEINNIPSDFKEYITGLYANQDLTFLSVDDLHTLFLTDPDSAFQILDGTASRGGTGNDGFPQRASSTTPDDYKDMLKKWYSDKIAQDKADILKNVQTVDPTKFVNDLKDNSSQFKSAFPDPTDPNYQNALGIYTNDPLTFAYQFGWKFDSVPVWFSPDYGFGIDKVGSMARSLYNEGADLNVDAINNDRSDDEAQQIWDKFRTDFRTNQAIEDLFGQYYPQAVPIHDVVDDGNGNSVDVVLQVNGQGADSGIYDRVVDLFMQFMWQDPYNRAWLVNATDKIGDGLKEVAEDILSLGLDNPGDANKWNFKNVRDVFHIFLQAGDVQVDPKTHIVQAPSARRYMEQNKVVGDDAKGIFQQGVEDISNWVDDNVGQLLGLISDTITGFVSSIRLSLMQMSNAVSQAGDMQRQANILNASLNDSIYYQAGDPGDLLRLVDNPFTREYGEPVVEVREPFQRIHFISSFDSIIDNKITENLNGVCTVVTAVSDGKYPVTVHFDKGIPPERQVEKLVETGLYWDNAVGSGLFGFLQPLLHPLESLRGFSKSVSGSADQLSARRVALWHLKNSLKNIYTGEVIIIGNADIRPNDLLYIADVYERMYGMVEVAQVIHHFTPDLGFVTAITPNAIVTINDPVRWTLLSYMWNKMTNYNMRDDMRAMMGVSIDNSLRADRALSDGIDSSDIYKQFSTQINGSVQHTQGSTAFIRDIGAVFTGGGIKALTAKDEAINEIANIDLALGIAKNAAPIVGGVVGFAAGSVGGAVVGATGAWAVGDLLWEGWQWVKENLLDQHGCYIQYLNKDGQPMDAGLSYAQGVAVGTSHTVSLFPSALGLSGSVRIKEDGHYRITIDDILGSLGYSEVETVSLYRDTSMFVNQINTQILKLAGRDPVSIPNENFMVFTARLLDLDGEIINQYGLNDSGIEDGDTIHVRVVDQGTSTYPVGSVQKIRFAVANAYELQHHDDDTTTGYNETDLNAPNDLGKQAYDYLRARFALESTRTMAFRVDKRNEKTFDRVIATIFHNVPLGTTNRVETLKAYALKSPPIPIDAYLPDGHPYTLNWEMVMTGFANVDMRETLWNTQWRLDALDYGVSAT